MSTHRPHPSTELTPPPPTAAPVPPPSSPATDSHVRIEHVEAAHGGDSHDSEVYQHVSDEGDKVNQFLEELKAGGGSGVVHGEVHQYEDERYHNHYHNQHGGHYQHNTDVPPNDSRVSFI